MAHVPFTGCGDANGSSGDTASVVDPKNQEDGEEERDKFLIYGSPGRIRTADLVINRRDPPGNGLPPVKYLQHPGES